MMSTKGVTSNMARSVWSSGQGRSPEIIELSSEGGEEGEEVRRVRTKNR